MRPAEHLPCPPRLEPVVLTGRWVRLEPLELRHTDDLAAVGLGVERIWRYLPAHLRTAEDLRDWIERARADQAGGLALPFAVVHGGTGRVVGSTRLFDYRPADGGIEIGYTWYAPDVWGSAVNPEAKLLLMAHAFEALGCVRVQLKTDARNSRSRAAIAGLGAREEGTLRKHLRLPDGFIRDSVHFSVLDDEWPEVKARLLARLRAYGGRSG